MNSIPQGKGKNKLILPPPKPTRVGNRVYFDPNRHPVLHASHVVLDMEAGIARLKSRALFSVGKFVDGNYTFSVPDTAMMRRHARAAYHTAFSQYLQVVCVLVALHTLAKEPISPVSLFPFRRAIESLRMFKIPQIDWICGSSSGNKLKVGAVIVDDLTIDDLPF